MRALHGIWLVFVFAIVEMAVVPASMPYCSCHALDREHIARSQRCLLVEKVLGGHTEQVHLDPHWTHVDLPGDSRTPIRLESRGIRVKVGDETEWRILPWQP